MSLAQTFIDFLEKEYALKKKYPLWKSQYPPPEEVVNKILESRNLSSAFYWSDFVSYSRGEISWGEISSCSSFLKWGPQDKLEKNKFYQCLLEAHNVFEEVISLEEWL